MTDSTWTTTTYLDTAWQSYAAGTFPQTPVNTARYYRATVPLPTNIADFAVFEIGANTREGIIIYINGQEIYRHNMPAGPVLATTPATAVDTNAAFRRVAHSTKKHLITTPASTTAVIAIEIHPMAGQAAAADTFDGYFIPLYGTSIKRSFGGVATSNPASSGSSEGPAKAFDFNRDTKWSASFGSGSATSLMYQFNDGRAEWISQYTIVSANDMPARDPKAFKFYGSNDNGLNYVLLDTKSFVTWVGRKQAISFPIPSNAVAYNMYKIEINSLRNEGANLAQFAEVIFYGTNSEIITGLQYPQTSFTWYTNVDQVYVAPRSTGFQTFTLTQPATLPAGLNFSITTGEIYGVPTAPFGGNFIISAVEAATQQTQTVTLTVSIIDCTSPAFTRVQVIKKNPSSGTAWSELYKIYNSANQLILNGEGVEGQTLTHNLCLPAGIYQLVLDDTDSTAWTTSSSITINLMSVSVNYPIVRTSLFGGSHAVVKFNAQFFIPEKDSTTVCNVNAAVAPASTWYTSAFTPDASWTPCLAAGSFVTSSRVQYFRNTFNVASKVDFNGFEVRLNATTAAVIYLNGQEVYRVNLPAGDVLPTTVPTATTVGYSFRSVTIDPSKVIVGANVLAIAQVLGTTEVLPHTSYFVYSARQLSEADSASRTWEITAAGPSRGNEPPSNMFDNNAHNRWMLNSESVTYNPVELTINYNDATRFEYLNYYCFINNYDSQHSDPTDWVFSGCVDGANCVTLDTESGIKWSSRNQRQCFYTETHTASYNSYKLVISKTVGYGTSNELAISEMQFYSVDFSSINVQPLSYTPASLTGYNNVEISTMTPTANYHKFSIVGNTLPSGLYLDSNSGYIYGTPVAYLPATQYTIQAYSPSNTVTTTIVTITVTSCVSPNSILKLQHTNPGGYSGYQMSFELQTEAGVRIDYRDSFSDWTTTYYSYCQPIGTYKLILSDAANDGWGGATISAFNKDGSLIGTWSPSTNESPKTITFQLAATIDPEATTWTYLNNLSIPAPTDNTWTQISYAAPGWASGTLATMGVPVGTTQYYRTLFTVTNLNSYAGFSFSINIRAGCVAYVNGVEIFRKNMPEGTITSTTLATADYVQTTTVGGSIHVQYSGATFVEGQNVFAVEVHKGNIAPTEAFFSAVFNMLEDNKNMLNNYQYTGANDNSSAAEKIGKALDGSVDTKWLSNGLREGSYLTITYKNNRQEYVNSYTVASANDCNVRHPSGWKVEGSDDGNTWTLLHQVTGHMWTAYKQSATFDFVPTKAFNRYRWTTTEFNNPAHEGDSFWCSGSMMQISELSYSIKRLGSICQATDGYGSAVEGSYSYKDCDQYYTGQKKRLCTAGVFGPEDLSGCVVNAPTVFTYPQNSYTFSVNVPITPVTPTVDTTALVFTSNFPLPNGLTLNPSTGVISGTPIVGANLSQYTITATNASGSKDVTIQISVEGTTVQVCNAEGEWPQTLAGQTANLACPAGQTGIRSRVCQPTTPPTWAAETNTCTAAGGTVTLNYPQSTYSLSVGVVVTITPTTTGTINSWTISPTVLPAGLTFTNGIITGVPTNEKAATPYTITAIGANVATATITISVTTETCPAEGEWPQTARGTVATLPCPAGQTGSRTRQCQAISPPSWAAEVNTCVYSAPVISYNPSSINVNVNTPITTMIPTVSGTVTSWSINTPLPAGLTFNTQNGYISGTPTVAISLSSYIITASNANASGSTTITITVVNPQCAADGLWPATNQGMTATLPCTESGMEGQRTRVCQNTNPPTWGAEVNGCTYITPQVSFNPVLVNGYVGVQLSVMPTVTPVGVVYTYTLSPGAPAGMTFSESTGQLFGVPTQQITNQVFTLTARNPSGKTGSGTFTLTIYSYKCAADGVWPETETGLTAYLTCDGLALSSRSRACVLRGTTGVWEPEDATSCIAASTNDNPAEGRSYVRFPITITNYNSNNVQGKQIDAIRRSMQTILTTYNIPLTSILIESKSSLATAFFAEGTQVVVRIETAASNVETIKQSGVTAISNGSFINTLRSLDTSFNGSTASVDSNSVSVTNHNAVTGGMIVLIVIVVIFVVIVIAVAVFCIMNRMKSSKSRANHKKLGGTKVPKAAVASKKTEDKKSTKV